MIGIPNTRVTILRGTATNYAGDEVDEDQGDPVAEDVPMFVMEGRPRATTAADGGARTIRTATAACDPRTDVQAQDRLVDQLAGKIYLVEAVYSPAGRQHAADQSLQLQRVN